MKKLTIIPVVLALVLLALSLSSQTGADEWNKKTVVTFDQDVEIPGQVLPAGTYVFKLFPSNSNRNLVQVWSEGESQLLATLITVGDTYPNDSGKPYFVLDTTGTDEGYPPAIVSWFFAGSDEGRDFIYSGYSNTRIVNSQVDYQSQPDQYQQPQPSQPDQTQPQQPQPECGWGCPPDQSQPAPSQPQQ
jgi:hypothetical protein